MFEVVVYIALILFGATLGSFAGATVWRLRARQLLFDKKNGEKVDAQEYKKLKKLLDTKGLKDRSRCLHCGYELKWYDLIPIISWLTHRGRCRQCRKPIGWFELAMEVGVAAFFVLSYIFWPFPIEDPLTIALFVTWLLAGVGLAILFGYDAKWFLLPDSANIFVAVMGLTSVVLTMFILDDVQGPLFGALWGVAIMSGIYLVLFLVSKGAWIGFGDVKLGIGLGLLLGDWQLAFLALFLANLIGCLIVIPLMARGKLSRTSQVPFGPLLIVGMIIAKLFGMMVLNWYFSIFI